jgi:glycerate-2-kinase
VNSVYYLGGLKPRPTVVAVAQHKLSAGLRKNAEQIFQAGIKAADPYLAVKQCLHIVDNQLQISLDNSSDKRRDGGWKKIHLIAFGKAACTMAKAAQEVIPAHLLTVPEPSAIMKM